MTALSVNLNKIALVRNSRPLAIPNPTHLGAIALDAGAHGLTVHPRPDQRHIRPADVHAIGALLRGRPGTEFNIEGNPFHDLMPLVLAARPQQCTLVPDDHGAATSDHGWDLVANGRRVAPLIAELKAAGIRVSVFMDPDPDAMVLARDAGADRIELYTEPYARAWGTAAQSASLAQYAATARAAQALGLGVNAGHDLSLHNLPDFLRAVPDVLEVSIGHALVADALELGMAGAVRAYVAACSLPRPETVR